MSLLTTPKELGGAGKPGNNPEKLFAAGYSACFLGAMKFVASQGGPKVPDNTTVTGSVGVGPRRKAVSASMSNSTFRCRACRASEAEQLIDKAHQVCPYSNALRGNVPVRLKLV